MKGKLINLAVILCSLLAAPIIALHHVRLYPVYSKSHQHTGYAAKVMIGEPEKQFTVLLDTVTTLFWVASPNQLQPFCVNKQTYSCRESSTCTTTRLGFLRQCYGRRIVIVSEYRDNISVVSLSGIRVNFANSSFGALGFLNWPEQEDYQQIDGVFGLSKLHFPDESFKEPLRSSALSERAPDNPVKSTLRKYQLPPFITIALPPLEYGEPAVLTLGGHNNRLCNLHREVTEPLRYNFLHAVANDQSRNRYEFEYKSIKMGNVSFSTQSMPAFAYPHAIKPYIGVPNEFLNAVVQNHNAKLDPTTQKYMVDCREAFEPFEIHTENSAYVVESRHFIIRHDQNDMQCELALRRRQSDFAEPVVLGIPFFHQYCVTLEPRHAQISFAPII